MMPKRYGQVTLVEVLVVVACFVVLIALLIPAVQQARGYSTPAIVPTITVDERGQTWLKAPGRYRMRIDTVIIEGEEYLLLSGPSEVSICPKVKGIQK